MSGEAFQEVVRSAEGVVDATERVEVALGGFLDAMRSWQRSALLLLAEANDVCEHPREARQYRTEGASLSEVYCGTCGETLRAAGMDVTGCLSPASRSV